MRSTDGEELDRLLDEQLTYYRALGEDYLNQCLDLPGGDEMTEVLDAFQPTGSVLELACGPGVWTGQLLRYAADVTAVDASPEMLAIAAAHVDRERVRFIQADLFTWKPDRRYDVVFIGFWLSHVPAERFESFWSLVADCLKPDGRVFFADDAYRTPDELVEGPSSSTIRRQIPDGTAYRLVKVPHQPAHLEGRLRQLGWDIKVTTTAGPFYWGAGSRGKRPEFELAAGPATPVAGPERWVVRDQRGLGGGRITEDSAQQAARGAGGPLGDPGPGGQGVLPRASDRPSPETRQQPHPVDVRHHIERLQT